MARPIRGSLKPAARARAPISATTIDPPLDATDPVEFRSAGRLRNPAEARTTKNPGQPGESNPSPSDILKHRWETRWRAAGLEIRSRAERFKPVGEPAKAAYGGGFQPVPLKEARAPQSGPVVPARAHRAGTTESAHGDQSAEAEIWEESSSYGKPCSTVPLSSLDSAAPAVETPALDIPHQRPESETNVPAVAPMSFWDNWAPSDEMIDSLREESERPVDREEFGDLPATALGRDAYGTTDDGAFDAEKENRKNASPVVDSHLALGEAAAQPAGVDAGLDEARGLAVNAATTDPLSQAAAAEGEPFGVVEPSIAPNAALDGTPAIEPQHSPRGLLFAAPVNDQRGAVLRGAGRTLEAQEESVSSSRGPASQGELPESASTIPGWRASRRDALGARLPGGSDGGSRSEDHESPTRRRDEAVPTASRSGGSTRAQAERPSRLVEPSLTDRRGNPPPRPGTPRSETPGLVRPREPMHEHVATWPDRAWQRGRTAPNGRPPATFSLCIMPASAAAHGQPRAGSPGLTQCRLSRASRESGLCQRGWRDRRLRYSCWSAARRVASSRLGGPAILTAPRS